MSGGIHTVIIDRVQEHVTLTVAAQFQGLSQGNFDSEARLIQDGDEHGVFHPGSKIPDGWVSVESTFEGSLLNVRQK